jgi:hypothetical protein
MGIKAKINQKGILELTVADVQSGRELTSTLRYE